SPPGRLAQDEDSGGISGAGEIHFWSEATKVSSPPAPPNAKSCRSRPNRVRASTVALKRRNCHLLFIDTSVFLNNEKTIIEGLFLKKEGI
ncbi:hypothetical protein, partial [Domibacillus enclensis]|uniref:hypothetical protein n=1 Tax=Domibacillus enclensis TaxID=1017273 RepID=UPI0005F7903C